MTDLRICVEKNNENIIDNKKDKKRVKKTFKTNSYFTFVNSWFAVLSNLILQIIKQYTNLLSFDLLTIYIIKLKFLEN